MKRQSAQEEMATTRRTRRTGPRAKADAPAVDSAVSAESHTFELTPRPEVAATSDAPAPPSATALTHPFTRPSRKPRRAPDYIVAQEMGSRMAAESISLTAKSALVAQPEVEAAETVASASLNGTVYDVAAPAVVAGPVAAAVEKLPQPVIDAVAPIETAAAVEAVEAVTAPSDVVIVPKPATKRRVGGAKKFHPALEKARRTRGGTTSIVAPDSIPHTVFSRAVAYLTGAPQEAPTANGEIIMVLSGKGGVGRTVIAANLASAIAQQHDARVALVDLALQFGDVAAVLNLPVAATLANLDVDDVTIPESLPHSLADAAGGIKVLPAPPRPELAEYITSAQVHQWLEQLKQHFDYIIVDTPQHLNDVTLDTIDLASRVMVLVDFSVAAVKDARLVLSVLDMLDLDGDHITVVANRHRPFSRGISKSAIESHLRRPIACELPFDSTTVERSIGDGIPFVVGSPSALISQQIATLATHVTNGGRLVSAQPAAPRFPLNNLFGRRAAVQESGLS